MKTTPVSGALILLTALMASAPLGAAGPNMQPGLWEITTKTVVPGMPMAAPPHTFRHCYRPADIKEARDMVPKDKTCKMDSVSQSGNAVSWAVTCNMDGSPMKGQGQITYAGQSYQGKVSMNGKMEGQDFRMSMEYSGRRVGDCK